MTSDDVTTRCDGPTAAEAVEWAVARARHTLEHPPLPENAAERCRRDPAGVVAEALPLASTVDVTRADERVAQVIETAVEQGLHAETDALLTRMAEELGGVVIVSHGNAIETVFCDESMQPLPEQPPSEPVLPLPEGVSRLLADPAFLDTACRLLHSLDCSPTRHPLPPLLAAWAVAQAAPEDMDSGAMLPALHRANPDETETLRLIEFAGEQPETGQLELPGLGGRRGDACPAWLLDLFDAAGGDSLSGGRGASWPLRLFVGALLHTPYARRDGRGLGLVLPARDVIHWLHPDGWSNMASRWQQLPDALRQLDQLRVHIPGVGLVRIVAVDVLPTCPDDYVSFRFVIPAGAARGARIDWPTLTGYGRESAGLYRGYLSAMAVLDHTAHKGQPVTAEIAAAVCHADGLPKRTKGGRIIRSAALGKEPHPQLRLVPEFTAGELARMAGLSDGREAKRRGAVAFERLDADGVIDLEAHGGRYRILGPAKTG